MILSDTIRFQSTLMELASEENIKLSRKINFSSMRARREWEEKSPPNEDDDQDVNIK